MPIPRGAKSPRVRSDMYLCASTTRGQIAPRQIRHVFYGRGQVTPRQIRHVFYVPLPHGVKSPRVRSDMSFTCLYHYGVKSPRVRVGMSFICLYHAGSSRPASDQTCLLRTFTTRGQITPRQIRHVLYVPLPRGVKSPRVRSDMHLMSCARACAHLVGVGACARASATAPTHR